MPPGVSFNVLSLVILALLCGYTLPLVANMCGAEAPRFSRSILVSVLAGAVTFLSFDLVAYGLVVGTRDVTNLVLPPGYSYLTWLQEPLYLKWQVLGLIPIIRYILIGTSICIAGILYVLVLKEHFRIALVIFLIQWTLNLVGLAVVSFLVERTLGIFHGPATGPPGQVASGPGGPHPTAHPEVRATTRPSQQRQRVRQPAPPSAKAPEPLHAATPLQQTLAEHEPKHTKFLEAFHEWLDPVTHHLEPYVQPIREAAQPYTHYLPPSVQEFLDDGGWWLVLLGLAVVFLLWVVHLFRRFRRALRRRRRRPAAARKDPFGKLRIELGIVSDAFSDPGPRQITVRGFPGRLRLVVLAPSSSYVGDLLPEMAENLLDFLSPGLGELVAIDQPRVVVWPRHASEGQFRQRFGQLVEVPDAEGRRSHWVVLTGSARLGRPTLFVGLAVFLDQASHVRKIEIDKDRWGETLGLQAAAQTV